MLLDINNRYVYGYYYENNRYYIYQNIEMNNVDLFGGEPTLVVGEGNPLYGYYAYSAYKNKITHTCLLTSGFVTLRIYLFKNFELIRRLLWQS